MLKRLQKRISYLLTIAILLSFVQAKAQTIIASAVAESDVHFANKNFEVGKLTVSLALPAGTTGTVTVTLGNGIEYVANSLVKESGTLNIAYTASSPANKPAFTLTGSGNIVFSIKRKVTKNASSTLFSNSNTFSDIVQVALSSGVSEQKVATYTPVIPVIIVTPSESAHNNASGTSVKTFTLENTGDGATRDIYFSVKYPSGVTSVEIKGPDGSVLSPVGNVPAGIGNNTGVALYKVTSTSPAGFKKADKVTISEKYTVTGCQSNRQIIYEAYWGESPAILYQVRDSGRAINVTTGTPKIEIDPDKNHTYFTWKDGICGATLGTFTVQYVNNGTGNATAYDVQLNITPYLSGKQFTNHKPANFRIVATDGTEYPITSVTPNGNEIVYRKAPLKELPALAEGLLTGKDIGLTDVDGDGFRDDFPINAKFKIRFDMVKNQGVKCLQEDERVFSVSPHSNFEYKDACGVQRTSPAQAVTNYTYRRLIAGVTDSSKFPVELPKDVSKFGYLIFGSTTYIAFEKTQGQDNKNNDSRFKYEIKLPTGVSLKNVKYYRGNDFGAPLEGPVALSDVGPGGTLSYTSPHPDKGYITFDMVLSNPCVSGDVEVQYSITHLDKNVNGTYCPLPLLCNKRTIKAICPGNCSNDGPRMVNTKTERADNSYGWKDYTMTTRVTRAEVSEAERQRSLYLDEIEVMAEGEQGTTSSNNLFYHAKVTKRADLLPKKITVKVGTHQVTLQATDPNVLTKGSTADGNFFRWNLTSALPSGTLNAGQKFSVVATYQVKNNGSSRGDSSFAKDTQSAAESFFYMLANVNDTDINAQGYHTRELHCGAKQTPTFYIAETYTLIGTNAYNIKACEVTNIGSNQVYLARRFSSSGSYFMDEFRPSRRIKSIKIKIPSTYNMVRDAQYEYRRKYTDWASGANEVKIPLTSFTITDDGTYKTYTYVNPPKGSPGYLHPGEISIENGYESSVRTWLQATCASKVFVNEAQATADNQHVYADIEFEDFYYHYAANGGSEIVTESHHESIKYSEKPAINLLTQTSQNITANKREQHINFQITNTSLSDAPYGWVSVPDVVGINVLGLEEVNASGNTLRTFSVATGISGEKMFFLDSDGQSGTIAKGAVKHYRLKYEITNCTKANITFDLYAGWNCNSNPTQGHIKTCHDKKVTYNVKIAKSLKQITPSTSNPGGGTGLGNISMCQKTKYEYTINSGDEGDIFDVKLVIIKQRGLTISDVEIEYPLGSGTKFSNITPVESNNKITYDLTSIFPGGSLPGSISESNVNKRNFKLIFMVKPDCEFTAGSSFDIDIEGNNLCGDPAEGDRSKAIIAGIQGVDVNKYKVNNSLTLEPGGNANACASPSYAIYKGKHIIVDTSIPMGTFSTGDKGLVVIRIPKGFEYVANSFTVGNKSKTTFADPSLPINPIAQVGGGESELNIKIPQGMKNADFFEYTIKIKQKDNTPATECRQAAELVYYTTDKVTGVACPGGGTCPAITIETTQQRGKVAIPVDRAKVKIENVQLTSVVVNNKEKVTFTYTLKNESATFAYTGDLKISLFLDTNNNQLVEEATDEFLQDFTVPSLSLAPGATQQKTHTIELDQSKVCRLLLSIRNNKNYCLCNNLAVITSAPTVLTDLVSDMSLCENEQKTLSYNTQAPTYENYTWEAVTSGALSYLSDSQVKNPVFRYSGAPLTTQQIFTYKLTIKRTNGCQASQQVQVTVKPATATPSAPNTHTFCQGATIASLKDYIDNTVSGTIRVYADNTTTTALADNVALTATTYYYSAEESGRCESDRAPFTVTIQNITAPTVVEAAAPTCTDISVAKLNYTANTTYTFVKSADNSVVTGVTVATDGVISNLPVGKYKVKATKDGCTSDLSAEFEIKDKEPATAITTSPAGATYTQNATATALSVVSSGTTPTAYKWYRNTTNSKTGSDVTQVATTATYTPLTSQIGSFFYWVELTGCGSVESAIAEIKVTPSIDAVDDGEKSVPSTGGEVEVLGNDKLNGNPATKDNVTVSIDNPNGLTGLTINEGKIVVPNGSTPGTYEVTYKICDKTHSNVCDTAKVKITVTGTPPPTIVANDDPDTSVAKGGTVDVLSNDRLNGNPVAPTDVDITIPNNGGLTNLTVDPSTGKLKIPTDATPGTYTVTYKICDKTHSNVCDTAKVKITVTGTPPPTIVANDDPDTSIAKGGTVDILSNDRLNGNPVAPTDVDITIPNKGGLTDLTVDPSTGKLKVPDDATPGTYEVEYRICVHGATSPCDTAKVKITVTGTPPPTITANDDPDTSVAKGGTVDILSNDRLNGNPVAPTDVDITIPNKGGLTNLTVDPSTGKLKIPTDATPGTYEVEYRICVHGATSPCDTAKVKITVTSAKRTIKAVDDNFGKISNSVDYTTTSTVFSSGVDTLEGVPGILSPETDVILHKGEVARQDGTAVQAGTITMNDNGSITVKAGTPIGIYTYTYKICEKAVPTNCSEEAKVTFEVVDNTILAKDDEYEVGTLGGLTPSVLNNDIFAGKVGVITNQVIIEPTSTERNDDPKLEMRFVDGRVDVKKDIAPGIHKYYYTISDKNDKTKSSSAIVIIKVVSFTAVDDEDEIINDKSKEQKIPSVLFNDEIAGKRPTPNEDVIFTPTKVKDKDGNEVPGIVINPQDGMITIAPNTPDGVYTYNYTICKKTAPTECKTAKGVLRLLPALEANDDDFTATPVNTTKRAVNVGNVLKNDKYAGEEALNNLDKLTAVIADNDGLVGAKIDEQGNLIIPQGTPVRVYNPTYYLCMKDHPGVCKIAKIKVEVIKDKPLTIYNGVSADGDGHNDYFKIDGIEYYPKNNLKIFNRWGVLVYEKDGYTNNQPFDGHSNGRVTISTDSKLPQGTYYYILEYEDSNDQSHTEKGWLYLKY